jgi:multidrug efflux pump subunit AcrA (membrane-fusion protein)
MKNKLYNLMMLAVVFALALTACGNQPAVATPSPAESVAVSSDGVVAEGKLKPAQAVNLSFQVRGMVEEVNAKIGDKVSKGDVFRPRQL